MAWSKQARAAAALARKKKRHIAGQPVGVNKATRDRAARLRLAAAGVKSYELKGKKRTKRKGNKVSVAKAARDVGRVYVRGKARNRTKAY